MRLFHKHKWKLIAKTYGKSLYEIGNVKVEKGNNEIFFGVTTLLWECQDIKCLALRKEEMLGKEEK